jgi:hypothetical protein
MRRTALAMAARIAPQAALEPYESNVRPVRSGGRFFMFARSADDDGRVAGPPVHVRDI